MFLKKFCIKILQMVVSLWCPYITLRYRSVVPSYVSVCFVTKYIFVILVVS